MLSRQVVESYTSWLEQTMLGDLQQKGLTLPTGSDLSKGEPSGQSEGAHISEISRRLGGKGISRLHPPLCFFAADVEVEEALEIIRYLQPLSAQQSWIPIWSLRRHICEHRAKRLGEGATATSKITQISEGLKQ
eukprot:GHVS01029521.1.p1 GENE.GHVS01029521.1~~GHVS01029521.1.p1  ORF type:complete len:134 (-),score=11.46 GHVS01029521.1:638-1039(-)